METGTIENLQKNGQFLNCDVKIFENNTILEFPFTYYPGYTVFVNGSIISSFESQNGLLAISLNKMDSSEVCISYTGTNFMNISKLISLLGLLLFIIYICTMSIIKII